MSEDNNVIDDQKQIPSSPSEILPEEPKQVSSSTVDETLAGKSKQVLTSIIFEILSLLPLLVAYAVSASIFLALISIASILNYWTKKLFLPEQLKGSLDLLVTVFVLCLLVHFVIYWFVITYRSRQKESDADNEIKSCGESTDQDSAQSLPQSSESLENPEAAAGKSELREGD